jgi:hypothetical protein
MKTYTLEDFKKWGREGGKAGTGKAKARTHDQAVRAGKARWAGRIAANHKE